MEKANLSLYHVARQPETDSTISQPPLLILLHGVGSNEDDLFSLTPYLDGRFLVLSVRGPYSMGPGRFGWYHVAFLPERIERDVKESEASRLALVQFISEAVRAYHADPERVYLMGFSQGSIMSLAVLLTEPELIAGAVIMSGSLPHEALEYAASPERLRDKPILVVHGVYDEILPITQARAMRKQLAQLPLRLDYREYPMRHQISDDSLDDVCGWLIDQLNGQVNGTSKPSTLDQVSHL